MAIDPPMLEPEQPPAPMMHPASAHAHKAWRPRFERCGVMLRVVCGTMRISSGSRHHCMERTPRREQISRRLPKHTPRQAQSKLVATQFGLGGCEAHHSRQQLRMAA